jgi:hypothetical protein
LEVPPRISAARIPGAMLLIGPISWVGAGV